MNQLIKRNSEKEKQFDWVALCALVVSIIALIYTASSTKESTNEQRKIQAYTYWQNFLVSAAENPGLANGFDSINGKSIEYLSDTNNRKVVKQDTATYTKYLEYAWFVANALATAEIVYNLQDFDKEWKNTLIEALGGHKAILYSAYNLDSYDPDFRKLLDEAFKGKRIK